MDHYFSGHSSSSLGQWVTQGQPYTTVVTDTDICNDIEDLPTIKAHAVLYTTSTDGNSNLQNRYIH